MKASEVYQTYLAIRQHFAESSYDYFKYHGKIRYQEDGFATSPHRFSYEKLARKFWGKPDELASFFACQFVHRPKMWIRDFTTPEADERYFMWKSYMESYSYHFKQCMIDLHEEYANSSFDDMFAIKNGQYPMVLKFHLEGGFPLEVLIGVDLVVRCFRPWREQIDDPIVWPTLHSSAVRYAPFLQLNRGKLKEIMRAEFVE